MYTYTNRFSIDSFQGGDSFNEAPNIDVSTLPKILRGKYFKLINLSGQNITVECNECLKKVKGSTNSTGNFRNHLKIHHIELFKKMEDDGSVSGEVPPPFKKPRQSLIGLKSVSADVVS